MAQALPFITAGLGVAGTLADASAERNQLNYQNQVAKNNATIAEYNAEEAVQTAAADAAQADLSAQGEIGNLLARQGASGLTIGVGSLAQVRSGKEILAKRDRDNILYRGERQAYNFRNDAADQRQQIKVNNAAKKNVTTKAILGVGSSLVSGATSYNRQKQAALEAK